MFFIRSGVVRVMATDEQTILAYMSEGTYFGEIGIVLQDKRSVSVLAETAVFLSSISKTRMLNILLNYKDYMDHLQAVAKQRLETSTRETVDMNMEIYVYSDISASEEDPMDIQDPFRDLPDSDSESSDDEDLAKCSRFARW